MTAHGSTSTARKQISQARELVGLVQLSGWTGVAAEVTASSLCWAGEAGSSRKPLAPYFKVAGRELVGDDAVGRGAYLFMQGAFILAKAKGAPKVAAASVDHLRRYIELLLQPAMHKGRKSP